MLPGTPARLQSEMPSAPDTGFHDRISVKWLKGGVQGRGVQGRGVQGRGVQGRGVQGGCVQGRAASWVSVA